MCSKRHFHIDVQYVLDLYLVWIITWRSIPIMEVKIIMWSPMHIYWIFGWLEQKILGNYLKSTYNHHCLFLTGNILVLITIFHFMKCKSVTNIFIANLSFGDILVIGFALPFRVSNGLIYLYSGPKQWEFIIIQTWLWIGQICSKNTI